MPIYLRALEPEDLELLYTIENEPELWAVNTNLEPYSRFALRKYIAEQPSDIYQSGALRLIICKKSDNTAIGIVDLFDFSPTHNRAEVAIAILKSERNKGYGVATLKALEEYSRKKYVSACFMLTFQSLTMKYVEIALHQQVITTSPCFPHGITTVRNSRM